MNCDHLKTKAGLHWGLPTKTNIGNYCKLNQAKQWVKSNEQSIKYIEHKKYVYMILIKTLV